MDEYIREIIAEEQGVDLLDDEDLCPYCGYPYFGHCNACGYEDKGFDEWCKNEQTPR
jgi:hypothetical protein